MAQCEDYPCCGHENGCCPDYDDCGRQLNMVCVCGAKLPVDNPSSLCNSCLWGDDDGQPSEYEEWQDYYGGDVEEYGTWGDY